MSGLDLDSLRGRWAEQGARIDAGVRLDVVALRAALDKRTRSARVRQMLAVGLQAAADFALLVALAVYAVARLDQPSWLLMALGFAAPVFAHLVAGVQQWRLLRDLDPAGPVPAALQAMAAVRSLRLRLARMIVLLSVLLWWPLLLLLLDALFGVDLMRWLHWSVLWGNVVAGVVFALLGWGVLRWLDRRHGHRPGLRAFLDETAGRGWLRLRDGLLDGERLDAAIETGDDLAVAAPPSDAALALLRPVHLRLWLGILAAAFAMLALGAFNATHGGQWHFIVPGVLLNLVFVAQLAFSIENRAALGKARGDAERLARVLATHADQREAVARVTLAFAPLWLPAAAQVLAKVGAGVDLLGAQWLPIALVAVATSAVLGWMAWRRPAVFPSRWVAVLALGVPAAMRRALGAS